MQCLIMFVVKQDSLTLGTMKEVSIITLHMVPSDIEYPLIFGNKNSHLPCVVIQII